MIVASLAAGAAAHATKQEKWFVLNWYYTIQCYYYTYGKV